jgi:hypothetical protein
MTSPSVSIAAAAAFSRIAYPEMRRYGYRRDFALGCVAGSVKPLNAHRNPRSKSGLALHFG